MNSLKNISSRRTSWYEVARLQSTNAAASSEIKIPKRIHRGSTEILMALQRTVPFEPTMPRYKYIDDPYLLPTSKIVARMCLVARESGRKMAMQIQSDHHHLFPTYQFIPQGYETPKRYTPKRQMTQKSLVNAISRGSVNDAIAIYNVIKSKVSDETKQHLLELLCYYNSNEPIKNILPELRWFSRIQPSLNNTWSNHPLVEQLFRHLKEQPDTAAEAYCAMISGTAKYLNVGTAWSLFEEAVTKNMNLNLDTYNYLLNTVGLREVKPQARITAIKLIFECMTKQNVAPNLLTMNNTLKMLCVVDRYERPANFIEDFIDRFRKMGIKPSLATYYYGFLAFGGKDKELESFYGRVLTRLEEEEFLTIQDPNDIKFFPMAMKIAGNDKFNPLYFERLHKIFSTTGEKKYFGSSLDEDRYYMMYFHNLFTHKGIDEFFEVYRKYVPHIYIPDHFIFEEIVTKLRQSANPAMIEKWLPGLVADIIEFEYSNRSRLMEALLNLIRTQFSTPDDSNYTLFTTLLLKFWNVIQRLIQRRRVSGQWKAEIFGDVVIILARGNNFHAVFEILDLLSNSDIPEGELTSCQITEMINLFVSKQCIPETLALLTYLTSSGTVCEAANIETLNALECTPSQKNKLGALIQSCSFE